MLHRPRFRRTHPPARPLLAGICTGLALLAGCGDASLPSETAAPPNLLLVSVDTLRADRLACYGGEPGVGAFLCGLAETGTRFEWALATAPYTAPSVASILTGLYPSTHGVTQTATSYLRAEVDTVAEHLQAAGYQTAAFVSNPILERSHRLDQGFEVYDQEMPREERNRPGMVEREAAATTDAALAWARAGARAPWFLWVHFQDPHGPYEPPGAPAVHDAPDEPRLPVLQEDHSGRDGIPAYQALPGLFTQRAYEQRYRAEIEYLDRHVGRLVRGLDALGAPPAVLLTADHGEAFGEDGYFFAHGHSVGLDQIRVPLLWRPAAPETPRVESRPVSLIDVAPTLLRVAAVEPPQHWPGQPLPLFADAAEATAGRAIFAEHSRRAAVVIGRGYYARNRRKVAPDEYDPNSGGRARLLPPRTARLGPSGEAPDYAPPVANAANRRLERALMAFLLDARRQRAGAAHEAVPDETRQRLRALGYTN
jgi:arylsulfatase A-like enzyme